MTDITETHYLKKINTTLALTIYGNANCVKEKRSTNAYPLKIPRTF